MPRISVLFGKTILLLALLISFDSKAQQDRLQLIEQRLRTLSVDMPGLNQKIEMSISNGSLQEFLKGLASTHNLNLNVDPSLNQKISSYFSNENVSTVLVYLAKQYNLEFTFTGSIISITPFRDPLANMPPPPKELKISYYSPSQTLTMDLQDDSLLTVARKITQLSNKNVVVMPELFPKKVTGYIQELSVQSALEKLAISNSFKITKTNDDVFVLEALKADEEIVTRGNNVPNPNYAVRKVDKGPSGPSSSTIQVFQNENGKTLITLSVANTPIKDVIKNIAGQAGINYFVYSDLAGNTTANVQNLEFDRVLTFILQGTNYTYSVDNGVYMIGEREDEGLRSHKLIKLQFRSVDSLLAIIPTELKKGVQIIEFKELNSFLLNGSQPQINEIETFVRQVDKVVTMVMIEVILMDVKKNRNIKTGIKGGVSDSARTGGTILGGLDFTVGAKDINHFIDQLGLNNVFNLGRVVPNFYISLQALEANENIELRQTPKLSTLNGHSANLSIGSTRYYSISTQNVMGSLNPQTIVTQQFIPVEANLSINIKPFVSGDDQITLNIDVDISDFLINTPINIPPPSSTSKFQSIIRVRNEEMIVLGGIERTEKSESSSGVPFLSRIPGLKWLFSSRSKTNGKTISVVFIKPTIIN